MDSQSSSDLAVAGMGDTLTGVCAGLLAQARAAGPATGSGHATGSGRAVEGGPAAERGSADAGGESADAVRRGADPAWAGALALYLSGRAATLAARGPGLTPSDVAERLPDALAELLEDDGPVTDLDLPFVILDADPPR